MRAAFRMPGREIVAGAAILAVFALLFAACGGTAEEGAGVQGASAGTVAGFASVSVNGIRYDNNAADVVIEGVHGLSVDNLDVGMRATVRGPFNDVAGTGTAQTILVEREIRGPLDNNGIDNALNTIRAMGQTVAVNPGTWFRGADDLFALQALQPDNASRPVVEVHGMRDGGGVIHATFVRKVADNAVLSGDVFLRGTIDNVDSLLRTFRIGGQRVDFGSPSLVKVNWPPLGTLVDGDVVDVTGTLGAFGGAGTLSASRIEFDNALVGRGGDRVKVDGYVVSVLPPSSFAMAGPRGTVAVTAPGVVPSGGALAVGARVLAEGTLSGPTLGASRIAVRAPNRVVLEGLPRSGSVNAAQKTLVLVGKTVAADLFTEYRDAASGLRTFGFGGVADSQTIRVVGAFDNATNRVSAARIERTGLAAPSPSSLVTAQGAVTFATPFTGPFTILGTLTGGIRVDGGVANTVYFDEGHAPLADRAAFMGRIAVGTVVRVRGGLFTAGAPGSIAEPAAGPPMEVEIVRIND